MKKEKYLIPILTLTIATELAGLPFDDTKDDLNYANSYDSSYAVEYYPAQLYAISGTATTVAYSASAVSEGLTWTTDSQGNFHLKV